MNGYHDAHENPKPPDSRNECVADTRLMTRESPRPPKKQKPETSKDSSGFELVGTLPDQSGTGAKVVRRVAVDYNLSKHAKPHQEDGVKFLWRNCFSDCNFSLRGEESKVG